MRRCLLVVLLLPLAGCEQAPLPLAGARWAKALHDPDIRLRQKAAFTLGNIGPSDPAVLPALIGALKDADAGVRTQAILSLVKLGPAAREATPTLAELRQRDGSARVRACAAQALTKIGEGP